ncbi:MAG: xylan 1,4-beta-xylosidase [Oscillibacter sp.]|nr:xylan 1,4-beta-xylosidase [Oscillibacter sp.]
MRTVQESGWAGGAEVWVDRETGVNYLYLYGGNAGGPTVLVDREGKPIITTVFDEE